MQSIRETRLWTICGWSPVPTNSWLEVGRRGNKFRGNYSSITNCCTAFAGRQLKVKSSCCSFFLRSYVSFYSEYCFNVISAFNWFLNKLFSNLQIFKQSAKHNHASVPTVSMIVVVSLGSSFWWDEVFVSCVPNFYWENGHFVKWTLVKRCSFSTTPQLHQSIKYITLSNTWFVTMLNAWVMTSWVLLKVYFDRSKSCVTNITVTTTSYLLPHRGYWLIGWHLFPDVYCVYTAQCKCHICFDFRKTLT